MILASKWTDLSTELYHKLLSSLELCLNQSIWKLKQSSPCFFKFATLAVVGIFRCLGVSYQRKKKVGLMGKDSDLMDKCLGIFPALLSQQKLA